MHAFTLLPIHAVVVASNYVDSSNPWICLRGNEQDFLAMETSCCMALSGSMVPSEFSVSKAQKARLMALAVFTIPSGFSRILGFSMGSMFVYSKVHPYIPVCECIFFKCKNANIFVQCKIKKNFNAKRKQFFMPPKELWEAYSNRTVRPSRFVSGAYLLYSLR